MSVERLDVSSPPSSSPVVDGGLSRLSFDVMHATVGFRHVISFRGVIDHSGVAAFRRVLEDAFTCSEREIWIDLTAVRELDSDAVDGLLLARRRLLAERRHFAVICPPGPVCSQLAAADHELVIQRTLEDAHRMS
jgi:anti-anti-sigma regulatory factor